MVISRWIWVNKRTSVILSSAICVEIKPKSLGVSNKTSSFSKNVNLHIVDIARVSITCRGEFTTSHVSGCDRSLALSNLAIKKDSIGASCKRCRSSCGGAEHRAWVITDEATENGVNFSSMNRRNWSWDCLDGNSSLSFSLTYRSIT